MTSERKYNLTVHFVNGGSVNMTLTSADTKEKALEDVKDFAEGFWIHQDDFSAWHPAHSILRITMREEENGVD